MSSHSYEYDVLTEESFSFKFTARRDSIKEGTEYSLQPNKFVNVTSTGVALKWEIGTRHRQAQPLHLILQHLNHREHGCQVRDVKGSVQVQYNLNGQQTDSQNSNGSWKLDANVLKVKEFHGKILISIKVGRLANAFPYESRRRPCVSTGFNIEKMLRDGLENGRFNDWADVKIKCSDGLLQSSRFILAEASPYYDAVFRNNAKNGTDQFELDHSELNVSVVSVFLQCIYVGGAINSTDKLSLDDKKSLLALADEVETKMSPQLVSYLGRVVTLATAEEGLGSVEEALDAFHFADLHGLSLLRNLALANLSGRLTELLPNIESRLKAEHLRELMELNQLRLGVGPADHNWNKQ